MRVAYEGAGSDSTVDSRGWLIQQKEARQLIAEVVGAHAEPPPQGFDSGRKLDRADFEP